jgi:hypothetical protein
VIKEGEIFYIPANVLCLDGEERTFCPPESCLGLILGNWRMPYVEVLLIRSGKRVHIPYYRIGGKVTTENFNVFKSALENGR